MTVTIAYTVDKSGPVPIAEVKATYKYPIQIPFMTAFKMTFAVDTYLPQPTT